MQTRKLVVWRRAVRPTLTFTLTLMGFIAMDRLDMHNPNHRIVPALCFIVCGAFVWGAFSES